MGSWARMCNHLHGLKPTLIMVFVQAIYAIVNIGYKLAANDGMRLSVLVAYRFMFGAAFIGPVAFFVERKKRPKLTWKIVFYGFLCGLLGGSLGQNLYLKSLILTSATFVSAMTNLIPAFTFVVAICLRLERLAWKTSAGKAKVFGTILGIGGAMLLTFYKGPELDLWKTNINLLEITSTHHQPNGQIRHGHNVVLGAVLALASCFCYSLLFIVQAKAAEVYPCPYSVTAMTTVWASIQGVVFALCTETDWSNWILGWDIRLLTVVVSGVLGSGLMFSFVAWCVGMRGPLFVSVFFPLLLLIVAIGGSLFMEEKLHLGMLLGGILIVGGLYFVLWGKSKELKMVSQLMPENHQDEKQVVIDNMPPPTALPLSGGSPGSSKRKSGAEGGRDSQSSSEVLSGHYIYS